MEKIFISKHRWDTVRLDSRGKKSFYTQMEYRETV